MRLYLSSFRVGDHPDQLVRLVDDNVRTALILNAADHKDRAARAASLRREIDELRSIGSIRSRSTCETTSTVTRGSSTSWEAAA